MSINRDTLHTIHNTVGVEGGKTVMTPTVAFFLLQAVSIIIFQTLTGLSFALSLQVKPSLFATTTVVQYSRRTRHLNLVWLLCALGWIALASIHSLQHGPESTASAGFSAFCLLLWLGAAACQRIVVRAYLRRLPVATANPDAGGASSSIIAVTECGDFVPRLQDLHEPYVVSTVHTALSMYGLSLTAAIALFGRLATSLAAPEWGGTWLAVLFVLTLYVSLAVLSVDLVHDVWPGIVSFVALQRAFSYYVYIFELWINWAIPAALLFVVVASVYGVLQGYAGVLVLGFPVWIVGCLLTASVWNAILHRRGWVRHRLPVLLSRNQYSSRDATWAYFFSCIHLVMAAWILVDILYVNVQFFATQAVK